MPFPKNDKELIDQGYRLEARIHCRGCGALIEFWLTPAGKHMPLDPGSLKPHWGTCPKANEFRKRK
jgi:hypothetical protein